MIGNDVVDLKLATIESNWKRKGYLDKIYTELEQNWIRNAQNPTEMVWILWSIKESTYKAYQRISNNRGYFPLKIKIAEITYEEKELFSKIELNHQLFHGKSYIENNIVHSIVVQFEADFKKLHYLENEVYYKNYLGLPFSTKNDKPLSISHHGRCREMVQLL